MQNKKPKIAILHDAFLYRGGGERLVSLMARALDADLVSGFFSDGSFDPRALGFTGKMISLGSPVFMKSVRHMILKWRFISHFKIFHGYDIVIFSGDCLEALWHIGSSTKKVYYCHTPPRYLYDFREKYLQSLPFFIRPIFSIAFWIFRHLYEFHLSRFDLIFTNSQNVHDRLMRFCGFESEILYPPTDVDRFTSVDSNTVKSGYFLSFARLSPPKRIDIIVEAFLRMPDQNLIFTYGKNDPMKNEILSKIEGKNNIRAIASPDDNELISLIQGATATIYIPVDEDFGMSPVESMACGTPVIGANEGGLKETIIPDKTGKLIEIQDFEKGVENLMNTIQATPIGAWESMKQKSISRAQDFSLDAFEKKLQSSLQNLK